MLRFKIILCFCCAFLLVSVANAQQFTPQKYQSPIAITYKIVYAKSKEVLYNITQQLIPTENGFNIEENGDNNKNGKDLITWKVKEVWVTSPELRAISYHKESSGAENQITDLKIEWPSGNGRYRFIDKDSGKQETNAFSAPKGTMLSGATFFLLPGFPFEKGPGYSVSFPVVMSESGQVYQLILTLEGEETVTVPAGNFHCYKLKFSPKMGGVAAIGNPLIPNMYIWFQKEAPHPWILFEGKEEGVTKPRTLNLLIKMEPGDALKKIE